MDSAGSRRQREKQRGSFEATGGSGTQLRGVLGKDPTGAGHEVRVQDGARLGGVGSWEALAALLRVPWEVGLLVAQGCCIDGSRPAARVLRKRRSHGRRRDSGRPESAALKRHLSFRKEISLLVLTHFPRLKGRQGRSWAKVGWWRCTFQKTRLSGTQHSPTSPDQGLCP